MSHQIITQDRENELPEDIINDEVEEVESEEVEDMFSMENVLKSLGQINKALYNVNPYA